MFSGVKKDVSTLLGSCKALEVLNDNPFLKTGSYSMSFEVTNCNLSAVDMVRSCAVGNDCHSGYYIQEHYIIPAVEKDVLLGSCTRLEMTNCNPFLKTDSYSIDLEVPNCNSVLNPYLKTDGNSMGLDLSICHPVLTIDGHLMVAGLLLEETIDRTRF